MRVAVSLVLLAIGVWCLIWAGGIFVTNDSNTEGWLVGALGALALGAGILLRPRRGS